MLNPEFQNETEMPTRLKTSALLSSALLCLMGAQPAMAHHVTVSGPANSAGAITTVSPETAKAGDLVLGVEFYVEDYSAFSDAELIEFAEDDNEGVHNTDTAYISTLGLEYGLTDRLSLSLALPFIIRNGIREAGHHGNDGDADGEEPEVEALGTADGVGDLQLGAKFALLDRETDGVGVALLAGLSIPTGATRQRTNDGERFEAEFQPGSGSWDPRFGLSLGKDFGPLSATANVLYTLRTEGSQDTNLGDHLAFNAGLSWRLGKGSHVHADGSFERHEALDLILEVNGEWEERERIGSVRDIHSGGTQIFLAPGLRYSSANGWSIFTSLGIPVHEDLNGIQNETDIRFKFGAGLNF